MRQKRECKRQFSIKFIANITIWQKMHQSAKVHLEVNLVTPLPPLLLNWSWMGHTLFPPISMMLLGSCSWRLPRFAQSFHPTQSKESFHGNMATEVEEGKGGHVFIPVRLALWSLYCGSRLQLRLPIPCAADLLGLSKRDGFRAVVKWPLSYAGFFLGCC
jgi:hypothetical protein